VAGGKFVKFCYYGRRRLGVPGRELYVEPMLYGVDCPDRVLGNRVNPKKGESNRRRRP